MRGPAALPQACRQFPRVATLSPLGVSLTLSAFCPTAASLLFDDAPFGIVADDGERGGELEGLDARGVMPPLLREGMLMDWDGVAEWEAQAVGALSEWRASPGTALEVIARASGDVCASWSPARGALAGALADAFARARAAAGSEPEQPDAPAIARYLAAHAFACWPMYDGRGIAGAVAHLRQVEAALNEERARQPGDSRPARARLETAIRQSDLRLRHAIA